MFFSRIKKCDDDRVIKGGTEVIDDFSRIGIKVNGFACCFKGNTFIFAFNYGDVYSKNIQTAMAEQFARKIPKEKKYKKIVYYSSERFDTECSKHCKDLWIRK